MYIANAINIDPPTDDTTIATIMPTLIDDVSEDDSIGSNS